jgi:cell division protein FtsW (lipid II flippase)
MTIKILASAHGTPRRLQLRWLHIWAVVANLQVSTVKGKLTIKILAAHLGSRHQSANQRESAQQKR